MSGNGSDDRQAPRLRSILDEVKRLRARPARPGGAGARRPGRTPEGPPFGWAPLQKFSPFRDTIRRHPRLFLLPPLLAFLIAVWVVAGAPKQYESSASLWFDNAPPETSSITQHTPLIDAVTPPANVAQGILDELLTTRHFRLQVGNNGPLASYLARHDSKGWGPGALLASLKSSDTVRDRIVHAIGPSTVSSKVAGPQVLAVKLRAPSPAVAAGTLRALIKEFGLERRTAQAAQAQAALVYYRDQQSGAQRALVTAQQRVASYVTAHPGARSCVSTRASSACDFNLKSLSDAQHAANVNLVQATTQFNQASIGLQSLPLGSAKIRVLDPPDVPTAALAGPSKIILAAIAGLFVGFLISLLASIGITTAELRTGAGDPFQRADSGLNDPDTAPAPAATRRGVFELADFPPLPAAPVAAREVVSGSTATAEVAERPDATPRRPPEPRGGPARRIGETVDEPTPEAAGTKPLNAAPAAEPRATSSPAAPAPTTTASPAVPEPRAGRPQQTPPVAAVPDTPSAPIAPLHKSARKAATTAPAVTDQPTARPAETPKPRSRSGPRKTGGVPPAIREPGESGPRFSGTLTDVHNVGTERARRPVWTVRQRAAEAFASPIGGLVRLIDGHDLSGTVRARHEAEDGRLDLEIEILEPAASAAETTDAIPPLDPRWAGSDVIFEAVPATSRRRRATRQPATQRKGEPDEQRPSEPSGDAPSVP
jgi:hypothetical protein